MNLREHLIVLIETYAKAKGNSPSHVGALLFSSGVKYRQLCEGRDITVGRLESAVRWLSDNWPADLPWPEGIARPAAKTPNEGEAA
jgi:hypothetical protein